MKEETGIGRFFGDAFRLAAAAAGASLFLRAPRCAAAVPPDGGGAEFGGLREVWDGNACAVTPLLSGRERPVIDGEFSEAEWGGGVKFAGFVEDPADGRKGLVNGRGGFVYLEADGESLYVAVRTTTPNCDPGGGLLAHAGRHDGDLSGDDTVEVLVNPDSERGRTYRLVFNSGGAFSDRLVTYEPFREDPSWDVEGLEKSSRVISGWWTLELRIPRAAVGSPAGGVRINVVRDWFGKRPSALIPACPVTDRSRMLGLSWGPGDVPAFRMDDLGAPGEGEWDVGLSARNIRGGRKCLLAAELVRMHYPEGKPHYSTRVALAGKTLEGDGGVRLRADCADDNTHWLYVMLKDLSDGRILARRALCGYRDFRTAGLIPPSAVFRLPGAGGGAAYNYPGYNKAVLRLRLNDSLDVAGVTVSTRRPGGAAVSVPARLEKRKWVAEAPGGPEEGEYVHSVELLLKNGEKRLFPSLAALEKRSFPWEHNKLGKDEIILPPFTPITAEGNGFGVLFRKHRINAAGLWDSAVSKGRELLAAPMRYELTVGGKKEVLPGAAPAGTVRRRADGYDAAADNSVSGAAGIALKTESRIDYDGFVWNRVGILNPGGRTIDRLTLVIPFKEKEAALLHAVGDVPDDNPGRAIPAGRGVVWAGAGVPHRTFYGRVLHPQFVPYIWLGTEERGISWMMESGYGTRLAENSPAVRIVREDGVVRLEIDLINVPTETREGDGFSFGLMASPVKPVDRELLRYMRDDRGGRIPGFKAEKSLCDELAGVTRFFKEPYAQDYGLMDAMTRMVSEGGRVEEHAAALKRWDEKYLDGLSALFKGMTITDGEDFMTWWKRCRGNFSRFEYASARNGPALPTLYSDPRLVSFLEPTGKYFLSEWCYGAVGYTHAYRSYPTPSNLDYMIHCYNQWLDHGIRGIYLDEVAIHPCFNTDTAARVDRYGQLHSETGALRLRELIRRIAVLQHLHKCSPRWLEVHMSNRLLIPCFSFATVQLGWEEHYGESEVQDRFPDDYMRSTLLGTKIGALSLALDGIYRRTTPQDKWDAGLFRHLNRTMMAVLLPHNVRPIQRVHNPNSGVDWDLVTKMYSVYGKFETWAADCRFVPYYEEDGGLAGVPGGVLASSYRRPGRALIVLGNQGGARKFRLILDSKKLGVPGDAVLTDAETGKAVPGGAIDLPRRDFKVLWLGPVTKKL